MGVILWGQHKNMQAQFICLAHNLMLILEQFLKKEGIENEIENNRRLKRLDRALASIKISKDKLPTFLTTPKRPTQQSVKFIRWLLQQLIYKHFMDRRYGGIEEHLRCFLILNFGHRC